MKTYNNNQWDKTYIKKKHISVWPWNDVIRIIKRKHTHKNKNILELGCGTGANIPFFLKEKYKYHGLDFSKTAIKSLKKIYPNLSKKLILTDIMKYEFYNLNKKFGIILDRGTLTHLEDEKIIELLSKLKKIIDKDCLLICCSLYCTSNSNIVKKNRIQHNFTSGIFKNLGYINFFNKRRLVKLFKGWLIVHMEKIVQNDLLTRTKISYWNIVLKKDEK